MKTTTKRSRYGKTSFERAAEQAAEVTVVHAAGLSLADAHKAAQAMPGRLVRTEKRGAAIVSVFA